MKEKISKFIRETIYITIIGTGLVCLIGYIVASDTYEKAKNKVRRTSVVKD